MAGRFQNIRVRYDGQWKEPTYCRVWNGSQWKDLGALDSYNTNSLYTMYNGNYQRVTRNRKDNIVTTDQWAAGAFKLIPANGYCFCPASTSAGSYNWYFRATIRKTTDSAQNIFYCGTGGTPGSPGANYVRVTWNANGTITITAAYNGTAYSLTSSNSVGKNTDVYLNVYANKGSYKTYIVFNGVTTSGNIYSSFLFNNSKNVVGDEYMQFRNTLSAAGVNASINTYSVSFNASTASGSDGSQYENVSHQVITTTVTTYE